ncbi:1634_t:CDS:2 [Dentiscutata erythropus]|uniref:1634_t:CDS:1 n=1 Tax=Dentiscutata erythropus TaxID=1348616 RepID=A0A9N9H794_9GLOM|nr:1634_t:CDS:2 [Dentiscutata erythropus]
MANNRTSNQINCVSLCNTNNSQQQRHRTTPSQAQFLENYFTNVDDFPDSNMREKIALKINMPSKSVHIWFQNRRAKRKQEDRTRQEQETIRSARSSSSSTSTSPLNRTILSQQQSRASELMITSRYLIYANTHGNHNRGSIASSRQSLAHVNRQTTLQNNCKLAPLRNVTSKDEIINSQGEGTMLPSLHRIVSQIVSTTFGDKNTPANRNNNASHNSSPKQFSSSSSSSSHEQPSTSSTLFCPPFKPSFSLHPSQFSVLHHAILNASCSNTASSGHMMVDSSYEKNSHSHRFNTVEKADESETHNGGVVSMRIDRLLT